MAAEQEIEDGLINKFKELKYTYNEKIRDKASLENNFREHFQRLNQVTLNDSEFARLKNSIINPDVFIASKTLRETNTFQREDGTPLHFTLVNIKDWCKNEFEVIRQLRINTEYSHHRYDVVLLINGVPVVHIELKSYLTSTKRAMEQIVEYKNDPGNGYTNSLLCFIQLFVVSNQTDTYYFANNRKEHFQFNQEERFLPIYQLADRDNKKITHLHDFADKFFAKCTLGQLISRYMVLVETEGKLLVMRPYQIYAVKAIIDCIKENKGNGYVWHTTGSGKTLTSFKASTLLKDNPEIEKCLFVVDRKDLDRQTRDEFNKFQPGCVEENTNTGKLVERLVSESYADKVIVATIQKLGLALDESRKRNIDDKKKGKMTFKERLKPLRDKRLAIIFDECHRSQFGENHQAIKEFFPQAQLFGFTGTPIFEQNAVQKQVKDTTRTLKTTEEIFQNQLHVYTISHAIEDRNVLRFHVDFFAKPEEMAANRSEKMQTVVDIILEKHDAVTDQRRFNALLATGGINDAIDYFSLFKEEQKNRQTEDPDYRPLNIACIFSPPPGGAKDGDENGNKDKDIRQFLEELFQEKADNKEEPEKKKKALEEIIADYNQQYNSNHRIGEFDLYYQDVQQRIKDQKYSNADYPRKNKIDLTIVVDMLLTGFDSHYLNTLYVDKNLKHHGLIQAFSRTNRVLNSTKPFGNILDFRGQEKEVDEAIALFSGIDGEQAKQIWLVEPPAVMIDKFDQAVGELENFMELQGLDCDYREVSNLSGDTAKLEFVGKFKEVQRLKTQLEQYINLSPEDQARIDTRISKEKLRGFRSKYLGIREEFRGQQRKSPEVIPEAEQTDFELSLFSSVIIDYDYIMNLMAKYTQAPPPQQKKARDDIVTLLTSHSNLLEEKEDAIEFVDSLPTEQGMSPEDIKKGYERFKREKQDRTLTALADKHGLGLEGLKQFVNDTIDRLILDEDKLSDLMAPLDLGWKERGRKEKELIRELLPLLKKIAGHERISGLGPYENDQE